MTTRLFFMLFFLCFGAFVQADGVDPEKICFPLTNDPIDVVIISHPKDQGTLDACINGIKENCSMVRRVIVVSAKRLTDQAEWFNEKDFPFSVNDVFMQIGRGNKEVALNYFSGHVHTPGWYFQQLAKLYASFVIPNLSSNVLVLDADTIFLNPVTFLNHSNGGLFCVSHFPARKRYIAHAERFLPGYKRVYPEVYSVCHHMLFQKPILEHLFKTVEDHHKTLFWKAFCECLSLKGNKGASEFEIYYNHALRHTDQVELRELLWDNSGELSRMREFKDKGYHFVSFHTFMRPKGKN